MTTSLQLPPIAATTVGSFPRPAWLARSERTRVAFVLADEVLREGQDDATALAIRDQERLGLDLLSDGEQRREAFIDHVLGGMDGFDLVNRADKAIRRSQNVRSVPRVVGKVSRRGPIVVADLRFAKAHTGRPIKMTVPGPMTAIDSSADEAYGDEAALAMDIAAALNAEILDLQAAGCDVIQIDEPAMTRFHEKAADYGVRALDRCLDGVTIPSIVHLCYGYPGGNLHQHEYQYPELLELLQGCRIGGYSMEFARSGYDPAVLAGCADRIVMFGCVDPGETPLEPIENVLDRVRGALRYVPPERLWLAPDCGLMVIERALARQKAAQLVEVAARLRREM
jgi:5-methyltetrahydropteroyltriglutamate--homocysteine methyltransferase